MATELFDAAVGLDLPRLRQASGSAATTQLLARQPGGVTLVHGLLSSFHFFKAGELSSLLPWPNASRTVYMHDVRSALSRAASVRAAARTHTSACSPFAPSHHCSVHDCLRVRARSPFCARC